MKNRIRELRQGHGVTQVALSDYLGISQSTLSYWEQGKYDIDNESLKKVADFFECSTDCILGREEVNHPQTEDDMFGLLSDREKEIITAYRYDVTIREMINRLLPVTSKEQKTRTIYRAANSKQHTEHGIEQRDESAMKRLAAAPKVKKEEDL